MDTNIYWITILNKYIEKYTTNRPKMKSFKPQLCVKRRRHWFSQVWKPSVLKMCKRQHIRFKMVIHCWSCCKDFEKTPSYVAIIQFFASYVYVFPQRMLKKDPWDHEKSKLSFPLLVFCSLRLIHVLSFRRIGPFKKGIKMNLDLTFLELKEIAEYQIIEVYQLLYLSYLAQCFLLFFCFVDLFYISKRGDISKVEEINRTCPHISSK